MILILILNTAIRVTMMIPGLVKKVYIQGSRHSTQEPPELIRSDFREGEAEFEWRAKGSKTYTVTAKGSITAIYSDEGYGFDFKSFQVKCSCPDGNRQRLLSLKRKQHYVCKHAFAALNTVLDQKAEKIFESEHLQWKEKLKAEKDRQNVEFPGERERIEHGLSKTSGEELIKILNRRIETTDGLKALMALLPNSVFPPKKSETCGRCNKEYDPQYISDTICRIPHPPEECCDEWEGTTCYQCQKTFNVKSFDSRKRGRNDLQDMGEFCFEGEHVPSVDFDPKKHGGTFDRDSL